MSDNASSENGGTGETGEAQAFGVPDAVAGASGDGNAHDPGRMQRVLDTHYGAGRFRTGKVIGRGGMSTVWLAYDTAEQRDVAVKVLKPELTDDAEFRARFRAEAEAAETVHSQHVVETYDYGEVPDVDGTGVTYCFIVMEYVQGESLADILARERTLPEVMALDLLTQAATGLQAIHDRGPSGAAVDPGGDPRGHAGADRPGDHRQ
jgi:serine/threonine-protein kinase